MICIPYTVYKLHFSVCIALKASIVISSKHKC